MRSQNAKHKGKRKVEARRNSLCYFEKRKLGLPDRHCLSSKALLRNKLDKAGDVILCDNKKKKHSHSQSYSEDF